ncbi:MAG: UDP-2,4-diacetamido-2,4,6-trideoxy-beta-L-altropyranose hydrolase, partial [Alphaproteobacteria bacterium]|nr:UDP-2,4-diacetamido-2,4,6-trideoxy-beta-L-altropyranose hydrolase [Alphaproteobacteria bacterium]
MNAATALFRCNASTTIGAGHTMRCLTLARVMAARGWHTRFAVNGQAVEVAPGLRDEASITIPREHEKDASWLAAKLQDGVDLIIVDHYGLDRSFERSARSFARRIVAIDDLGQRSHDADVLIDATLNGEPADYAGLIPDHTLCLMGADYALLRPAFARIRRNLPPPRDGVDQVRVLVSLGATDPGNATALVLDALRHVEAAVSVTIVLGSAAPHVREIRERLGTLPYPSRMLEGVEEMADLVADHDLVVGASGMSAWERCCLGIPSLLLLTAENQERSAKALTQAGAAYCPGYATAQSERQLGDLLQDIVRDRDELRRMGERALALCDGLGAYRVANALDVPLSCRSGETIRLRPLCHADSAQILEWRRHPDTR